MSSQHKSFLPLVTPDIISTTVTEDAVEGVGDPYHKEWFHQYLADNPDLARVILQIAEAKSDGDSLVQDKIIGTVAFCLRVIDNALVAHSRATLKD